MKKKTPGTVHPHPLQWAPDKLKLFFTEHLNRIYCTRAHLAERLLEIMDTTNFTDLKQPMSDTLRETEEQIARMDGIYTLLDKQYSFENCNSLISLLEDEFTLIQMQVEDKILRDMCLLSYLQSVEDIEANAINVVKISAIEKQDDQIISFLNDHLDRATAKRMLQNFILSKYTNK